MKKPAWKKPHLPRLSKMQIVLVLAGLLVVFTVGRALLSGVGGGAVDVTGQGGNTGSPAPSTRGPAAEIGGHQVPGAGPVAVLNPGLAQPGARIGVEGTGFDPGAGVDVFLSGSAGQPAGVASGTADKSGAFKAEFGFPAEAMNMGPSVLVTVKQQDSDKVAKADLVVRAGAGTVKASDNTAAPGSTITVDAEGFLPGEQINAYWGAAIGTPSATMKADEAGRVSKEPVKVGVSAAGDSTLVLVGDKSKTTAAAPFTMLSLYPTAATEPFAAKAGETIGLSGGGFAPDERVLVYVNESTGPPVFVLQAGPDGGLAASDFRVPFGLTGQHTLILTGEQSRASVTSGFMVLPYTPTARAGTYGGLPGTVLNFYAHDFAPNEVVKVYTGADANNAGVLVAAFRVDERGSAGAQGSYVIPGDAQGELGFTLVGSKSKASATATVTVEKTEGPVNVPKQPPYVLPPELSD